MIRPLLQSDYSVVTAIYSTAFDGTKNSIAALTKTWDSRSHENSYGIFSNDKMIGFAICSFHPKTDNNSFMNLYLDYLAIDTEYQGHGFGSKLLSHLIRVCFTEGRGIYLFPDSSELASWYKSFGFCETLETDPLEGIAPYFLKCANG